MKRSEKNRVLILSSNKRGGWGGAEKYWYEPLMLPAFSESHHFSTVLKTGEVNNQRAKALETAGVLARLHPADTDAHKQTPFATRVLRRMGLLKRPIRPGSLDWVCPYITELQPDVVWFNLGAFGSLVNFEKAMDHCVAAEVPYFVVFQHGVEGFLFQSESNRNRFDRLLQSAAHAVFVSRRNQRSLEIALGRQIPNAWNGSNTLLPGVIDRAASVAYEHPIGVEARVRFIHVGRFEPEHKGQHLLLEALGRDHWRARNWHLTFYGFGDDGRRMMERWIRHFNVPDDKVLISGYTEDPFDAIGRADILVMPSLSEGSPFALLESMATGRPAVGTPVAGIPEVIQDGVNGWLADSCSVDSIDAALCRCWDARPRWHTLSQAACQTIRERFNQETESRRLAELISEIAEKSDSLAHRMPTNR